MRSLRLLASMAAAITLTSSLVLVTSTTASAAESMPTLQYPAVNLANYIDSPVPGGSGSTTLPCNTVYNANLVTYSSSGTLTRQLDRTQFVDGVSNCITNPVVDKNDVLYGITEGTTPSGSYATGQYLYAYAGNSLKWKYPLACGSSQGSKYVIGATGNIYATAWLSDGMHLIGLTPELESGQTQPTKVFDIKVTDDCSTVLFPYRDGIMLRGQNSGFRFYTYSGVLLAQPTSVSNFWYSKLNATGQLFNTQTTWSGYTSASVSMYDPLSNQAVWTTAASTSGANVQNIAVYPLANGGVVALIREQKMASPGVPATPSEYIENLVPITAGGVRGTPFTLPKTTAEGEMGAWSQVVTATV